MISLYTLRTVEQNSSFWKAPCDLIRKRSVISKSQLHDLYLSVLHFHFTQLRVPGTTVAKELWVWLGLDDGSRMLGWHMFVISLV